MLKRFLIVTIRAIRGSSTGKAVAVLTLVGAGYGATQLVTLLSERSSQRTMLAGSDDSLETEQTVRADGAWSETLGERDYERVVSVALLPGEEIAFAGLSVGLNPEDGSEARLVRTDMGGTVLSDTLLNGLDDATVSDIELGNDGDAFFTSWQEGAIKVTKLDPTGRFLWERQFSVSNQAARVIVAPSPDGAAMVLLSEAFEEGEMRVMRLDNDGRVVWRRDVMIALGGTRSLGVSADSIGGGVFAASVAQEDGTPGVELVRLDRRGREIWRQTVRSGPDAGLSDLYVDADGVSVLIGGVGAQVFKLDPLGQFIWARDLPDISATGSRIVGRSDTGELHVIAEPAERSDGSRLWIASFDADGRPRWTRLREHNRNVRIEDFEVDSRGGIFAGGAMSRRLNSDSDMLMFYVTPDGQFPDGFTAVTLSEADVSRPSERGPLVTLETGEPLVTAGLPAPGAGTGAGERIIVSTPVDEVPDPLDSVREVSAPGTMAVAAVAVPPVEEAGDDTEAPDGDAPGAADGALAEVAPGAEATPEDTPPEPQDEAASELAETDPPAEAAEPAGPPVQSVAAPSGTLSGSYSYDCTFICQATMVDESLKFPVTRRIADVSESNAELFSLDAMALDSGICLAEGGKLADGARLPPVCERVN